MNLLKSAIYCDIYCNRGVLAEKIREADRDSRGDSMATPPELPTVVYTDMFPERERFDAWREVFALRLVRVDVATPDPTRFRATIGMQQFGDVAIVSCDVNQISLIRTKELARDGIDDVSFVIGRTGRAAARFN